MSRTILTIAAIVAAIAIYDRTAATSSEPAPRTVSGGPTVVFLPFSVVSLEGQDNELATTGTLTFEVPVTILVDAKIRYDGPSSALQRSIRLNFTPLGEEEVQLDKSWSRLSTARDTLAVASPMNWNRAHTPID